MASLVTCQRIGQALTSWIKALAGQPAANSLFEQLQPFDPVDFAPGLVVNDARFTVSYDDGVYQADAAEVPFTTTGTFDPTQWRLISGGNSFFIQSGAGAERRKVQDKLLDYAVTPEDFGAVGDGVADDRAAMVAAANQALASGRRLRLGRSRTYFMGTATALTLPEIVVEAEPGARITGNVELHTQARFDTPLTVVRDDGLNEYIPYDFLPQSHLRRTEPPIFQGEGDLDRGVVGSIVMSGMIHQRLAWPAGTDWETFAPDLSSADAVGSNLPGTGDYFYGHFQVAEGATEFNATYDTGIYVRAIMLRCSDGLRMFYCQQDGDGNINFKPTAGAPTTVSAGITWEGKATHESWYPSRSEWTIRLYDLRTWSVLLNGREVIPPQTLPADQVIEFAGFGYAGDGPATTALVRYATKVVNGHSSGRGNLDLIFVGDSTTADIHGAYPDFIRRFIEDSHGFKVGQLRNYAQDGATTAIQLSTLQTRGVLGATDVIINTGTNDVQNPGAAGSLDDALASLEQMIDYCQARNKRVTGVIFPTWYAKALTSADVGVGTANYQLSALYRSAYRKLFARKGCQIVDLNMELRSALASDLDNNQIDPGLRDNIHYTPRRAAAAAWAVARKLAGYTPLKTHLVKPAAVPSSFLRNGWTADGPVEYGMSESSQMIFSGKLAAGTLADGTQVMKIPASLAPRATQVHMVRLASGTAFGTLIIDSGGSALIYNATGETGFYLDGVTYFVRAT